MNLKDYTRLTGYINKAADKQSTKRQLTASPCKPECEDRVVSAHQCSGGPNLCPETGNPQVIGGSTYFL